MATPISNSPTPFAAPPPLPESPQSAPTPQQSGKPLLNPGLKQLANQFAKGPGGTPPPPELQAQGDFVGGRIHGGHHRAAAFKGPVQRRPVQEKEKRKSSESKKATKKTLNKDEAEVGFQPVTWVLDKFQDGGNDEDSRAKLDESLADRKISPFGRFQIYQQSDTQVDALPVNEEVKAAMHLKFDGSMNKLQKDHPDEIRDGLQATSHVRETLATALSMIDQEGRDIWETDMTKLRTFEKGKPIQAFKELALAQLLFKAYGAEGFEAAARSHHKRQAMGL